MMNIEKLFKNKRMLNKSVKFGVRTGIGIWGVNALHFLNIYQCYHGKKFLLRNLLILKQLSIGLRKILVENVFSRNL